MPTITENRKVFTRTPKRFWELSKLMARLARNVFAQMRIAHAYKMKIAALEQERDQKISDMKMLEDELVSKIFAFIHGRKDEIMCNGKSITLATGQVGWREMKPAVEIAPHFTKKQVIAALQRRCRRYLRFTPEINKEQILKDVHDGKLKKVPGITIRQGEEAFISLTPRGKERPEIITTVAE